MDLEKGKHVRHVENISKSKNTEELEYFAWRV